MPTTDQYLDEIAETAVATPRAEGGRVVTVKITLYNPKATAITAPGCTGLMLNDDDELLAGVATVIERVRRRM